MSDPAEPAIGTVHSPRGRWLVWTAIGVAVAFLVWTAGVLQALPQLPARSQADSVTGLVSMLGDLAARLAALATMGGLAGIVVIAPAGPDGGLSEAGRRWKRTGAASPRAKTASVITQ